MLKVFVVQKAITITLVVWRTHDEQLMTIGDAAASFIQEPDLVTKGLCLYAREDFDHWYLSAHNHSSARSFKSEAKRRAVAASRRRWISIIILSVSRINAD